jgi:hypothetical protein
MKFLFHESFSIYQLVYSFTCAMRDWFPQRGTFYGTLFLRCLIISWSKKNSALGDAVHDHTSSAHKRGPISTEFIPSHFSHNYRNLHWNIILQLTLNSIKWALPSKFYNVLCVLHTTTTTSLHFQLTGSTGPGWTNLSGLAKDQHPHVKIIK